LTSSSLRDLLFKHNKKVQEKRRTLERRNETNGACQMRNVFDFAEIVRVVVWWDIKIAT